MRRKSVSKKARFEVLKRDKFTCQYCGSRAPDVLLQVDHIHPVAKGGANELLNLITSCAACNGGKGARELSDDSALAKQRGQLDDLQARREQLEMMVEWQKGLLSLDQEAVAGVADIYKALVPGWSLNESGLAMVRALITQHGLAETLAVLRSVAGKSVRLVNGKATDESVEIVIGTWKRTLQYQAQNRKDPVGSRMRYIRGIIRNRCRYCPEGACLAKIREAYEAGVSLDDVQDAAIEARAYTHWEYAIDQMIEKAAP